MCRIVLQLEVLLSISRRQELKLENLVVHTIWDMKSV
jgi:hypothetical protein